MVNGTVLVIDDNPNVLSALEILLSPEYKKVITLNDPKKIASLPNIEKIDLVLLDMNFTSSIKSGDEGLKWLAEIKNKVPSIKIIMITAYGDVELAVKAIKNGASDFVLKPWKNEQLLTTLKTAYLQKKATTSNNLVGQTSSKNVLIGSSSAFQETLQLIQKVSKLEVNIFISGENGTGKELLAKEFQLHSLRKEKTFVTVDLGALPPDQMEKYLWGDQQFKGSIEKAQNGILFIDSIEKLPLQLQSKLLLTLNDQKVARIDAKAEIIRETPINIQLISSASSNLKKEVKSGNFREDLLYQISTIHVAVPPLRNRGNDITELADYYLAFFKKKYQKNNIEFHTDIKKKITEYNWPGNVRELKHAIERAVILNSGPLLRGEDLNVENNHNFTAQNPITLSEMELVMIEKALSDHQGNYSAAANQLGISRQTLYNKMKKLSTNG